MFLGKQTATDHPIRVLSMSQHSTRDHRRYLQFGFEIIE
jgi:hypothetical protein